MLVSSALEPRLLSTLAPAELCVVPPLVPQGSGTVQDMTYLLLSINVLRRCIFGFIHFTHDIEEMFIFFTYTHEDVGK